MVLEQPSPVLHSYAIRGYLFINTMAHSPAFKKLFIELSPNNAHFVDSHFCMLFIDDVMDPNSILEAKTLEEAHEIASMQKKINNLRILAEKDKLHNWVKVQ